MGFAFTPLALVGFAYLALLAPLAWLVYQAAPRAPANRRLAVMLALYAAMMLTRLSLRPMATDVATAFAAAVLYASIICALVPFYLLVVATLDSPLTAPLRAPLARRGLVALALAGAALPVVAPSLFMPALAPPVLNPFLGEFVFVDGPAYRLMTVVVALALVFTLSAAVHAWRRAPRGSLARTRAGAFALAFGLHDLLFITSLSVVIFAGKGSYTGDALIDGYLLATEIAAPALLGVLLAYAILRLHLFDIDLRIKRGISRGTLVGAFLVAFVLVAETAQNWLNDTQGYLVGGAAAALMVLALRPIERAADRLANAAMPGVTGSPQYVVYRKLQVYRATVENALEDGALSEKERAMLGALARELGIRAEDARAVEAEAGASAT